MQYVALLRGIHVGGANKVDRKNATRNGLLALAGVPLNKRVTIRNSNTTRKLLELMK